MKRLLITGVVGVAALAVGFSVAAAATSGGSDASVTGRPTVSAKRLAGAGRVLVDSKGRALYTNDEERGPTVLCTGGCLSFWKPLTVSGTPKRSSLPGKLGVARRPDGGRQVTYNGKRLYTFTLDKPGHVSGDGFKDAFGGRKLTWHVARPRAVANPSPTPSTTPTYP